MKAQIKAHFDGRVLVPDEPVDWPVNQPLVLAMVVRDGVASVEIVGPNPSGANGANGHGEHGTNGHANGEGKVVDGLDPDVIADRIRRLRLGAGAMSGPVLSDEALRRENIYEDRA